MGFQAFLGKTPFTVPVVVDDVHLCLEPLHRT